MTPPSATIVMGYRDCTTTVTGSVANLNNSNVVSIHGTVTASDAHVPSFSDAATLNINLDDAISVTIHN